MAISSGSGRSLQQTLQTCPLNITANASFMRLPEQTTHDVFLVEDGASCYVVKRFYPESYTQLNRSAVFNAQQKLAEIGIAPKPLWFDAEQGIWVESFVERTYFAEQSDEKKAETLGKVLGEVHNLVLDENPLPGLDLPQQWTRYLDHVSIYDQQAWQSEVDQGTTDYNEFFDNEPRVICHNDLSLSHVLNATSPVVVDWEYAALGNRYFDIASAVFINQISRHCLNNLCNSYAEISGLSTENILLGVKQMKHSVRITHALWYEAKSALPLPSHTYNAQPR